MEKIIIYNVADARKIITMAANMRIKSIVIDNTKLSDTLENVLAYSQDYRTGDIMPFINKDESIVIFCDVTQKHLDKLLFGIRNNNLNVDYKAVMTKTNKSWTLNKILYHMEIEKKNERR